MSNEPKCLQPLQSSKTSEDVVIQSLGKRVGVWQWRTLFFSSFVTLNITMGFMGIVFLAPKAKFKCASSNASCFDDQGMPCTEWVYDKEHFSETIVMKWNLVCERSYLVSFSQSLYMLGVMVGGFMFSILSDEYGRKSSLVASAMIRALAGSMSAFSPSLTILNAFRFAEGVGLGGAVTVAQVMNGEISVAKSRSRIMTASNICAYIGTCLAALIASVVTNWQLYQITTSAPLFLLIFAIWIAPESPRWLIAKGKSEKALQVLAKAATENKNPLPSQLQASKEEIKSKYGFTDLVKRDLRGRTFPILLVFFACGFCYYGLTQYLSQVGGNVLISIALSGALSIPGALASVLIMNKKGRRTSLVLGFVVIAACSFGVMFFQGNQLEYFRVAAAVLATAGNGIAFPTAYLYASELFPTVIRNRAMGAGVITCRLGSMVAPAAILLERTSFFLPPALFGIAATCAAVAGLFLPETLGKKLPATLEDIKSNRNDAL